MENLRLFIAIDLPAEVKRLLTQLQTQLRPHTRAIRWADPQGIHLTLKFLGSTSAEAVPEIITEMERAAGHHRSFDLQTAALGVFPNPKRPRVVWLGVGGDVPALQALRNDVECYVAPLGFPTEQRSFSPHLTLGRSVKDPNPADLAAIGHAVQQTNVLQNAVFPVREVVLMRSELLPQGARYTPLAHIGLDDPA